MRQISETNRKAQKELTQEKLIQALLQYPTIKAAAKSVGITDRTAQNYLDEPAFQQAYVKAKEAMFAEIRNGLIGLASKAATGLYELMDDPETPHATRVRAYQLALDRGLPIPTSMQQEQTAASGVPMIDPGAMSYITNEELDIIEGIIAQAEQRKAEEAKQP